MLQIYGGVVLLDSKYQLGISQFKIFPFAIRGNLSSKRPTLGFRGQSLKACVDLYDNGLIEYEGNKPKPKASQKLKQKQVVREEQEKFTVSYLMNSCGFSLETAQALSKSVRFGGPEKPDSVINMFKSYGFTSTHIAKIVRVLPMLLSAKAEKTLSPKLEFFLSIGVSHDDLPNLICVDVNLLRHSLEKKLIPCYKALKSVVIDEEKVVDYLKYRPRFFSLPVVSAMVRNIEFLRIAGVPQSVITYFVFQSPIAASSTHSEFVRVVLKIKEMGFDPSKTLFLMAVLAKLRVTESTWELKREAYRKWGLSDDEISLAFKKHPLCMLLSVEKIMSMMDFLVDKLGLQAAAIARSPYILLYSLEKRIIPRGLIIRLLQSKGLVSEELSLYPVFQCKEKVFMERFVNKYQEQVPELMSILEGKMGPSELGFLLEEKSGAAKL